LTSNIVKWLKSDYLILLHYLPQTGGHSLLNLSRAAPPIRPSRHSSPCFFSPIPLKSNRISSGSSVVLAYSTQAS
jgi:hypothetical protein